MSFSVPGGRRSQGATRGFTSHGGALMHAAAGMFRLVTAAVRVVVPAEHPPPHWPFIETAVGILSKFQHFYGDAECMRMSPPGKEAIATFIGAAGHVM